MIEHKSGVFELSDMDKERRTAIIAHAVYDNIDRYGDICRKGMFKKSWTETKAGDIRFDIDHDKKLQPGTVLATYEEETKAYTKVKFGSHTLGNDTMLMMDEGIIRGASFEYIAEKKGMIEVKGKKVRELKEVKHLATTVTLSLPPVNPLAGVVSVTKSMDLDSVLAEYKGRIENMEKFCRGTSASDECIKSILDEIKEAKSFLYGEDKEPEDNGGEFRRRLMLLNMQMESKAWDESKHPRHPKGSAQGGEFSGNNLKNEIIKELDEAGISYTGVYEKLPNIIFNAVDTVKDLGYDYWESSTTTGVKVKDIVKKLSGIKN